MSRAVLLATLALAACEAPLDPLLPTDARYSLSGYLDASADSQWIRVEPLGSVIESSPAEPLDVVVTLAPVGGGVPDTLAQSVRQTVTGPAHLFGARARVEPGQTYRVEVRADDGAVTATAVTVPDSTVVVDVQPGPNNCPVFVFAEGAERLADVQARYVVRDVTGRVRSYRFTHLAAIERVSEEAYQAEVYSGDDTSRMSLASADEIVSAEIVVAVASAEWPETVGLTLEAAIGYTGAVQNGFGFVGGVITRRFPFTPVISRGQSCMSGRV